jgi:membrane-bound serine protease (ClpP class)
MLLGFALLCVELFVLPGFGIAGILGILAIGVALIANFMPVVEDLPPLGVPDLSGVGQAFRTGMTVLISSAAVSLAGIFLLMRFLPEMRVAEGILSDNPVAPTLTPTDAMSQVAQIGDIGVVTGTLRPAGMARFGQEVVEVATQGQYVDMGQKVQVIKHEGKSIIVRPVADESATA